MTTPPDPRQAARRDRELRKREDARWLHRTTLWVAAGSVLGALGFTGLAANHTSSTRDAAATTTTAAAATASGSSDDALVQRTSRGEDGRGDEGREEGGDDGGWFNGEDDDESGGGWSDGGAVGSPAGQGQPAAHSGGS